MKRSLTLLEKATILKNSKVFGECVNKMIAHTSLFNTNVPHVHSLTK